MQGRDRGDLSRALPIRPPPRLASRSQLRARPQLHLQHLVHPPSNADRRHLRRRPHRQRQLQLRRHQCRPPAKIRLSSGRAISAAFTPTPITPSSLRHHPRGRHADGQRAQRLTARSPIAETYGVGLHAAHVHSGKSRGSRRRRASSARRNRTGELELRATARADPHLQEKTSKKPGISGLVKFYQGEFGEAMVFANFNQTYTPVFTIDQRLATLRRKIPRSRRQRPKSSA